MLWVFMSKMFFRNIAPLCYAPFFLNLCLVNVNSEYNLFVLWIRDVVFIVDK